MTAAAPTGEGMTVPAGDAECPSPAPGALLPEAIRMLSAFAGLGAGTLSFGISSTLLASAGSPWSWAGVLAAAAWGIALTVWAVQSLRFRTPIWSGAVVRLVPVAVLAHLAAVIHGLGWVPAPARTLDLAALSALALELVLLASAGWLARNGLLRSGPPAVAPAAGRLLPALFAAALAVAAITTPGLAATAAGQHAVPHGEHGSPDIQGPAGHRH
jgi:hypothetical protein